MKKGILGVGLYLFLFNLCFAKAHYGMMVTYPYKSREPENLHGFQVFFTYDPERLQWPHWNIYFDAGFSQFWLNRVPNYTTISIYSIAPILRYTFFNSSYVAPYAEVSVGPSYLNHTRIGSRNLGIHFAFQDRLGVGALLGPKQNLALGLQAVHYSNAHLSSHNSGITIPFTLALSYNFY